MPLLSSREAQRIFDFPAHFSERQQRSGKASGSAGPSSREQQGPAPAATLLFPPLTPYPPTPCPGEAGNPRGLLWPCMDGLVWPCPLGHGMCHGPAEIPQSSPSHSERHGDPPALPIPPHMVSSTVPGPSPSHRMPSAFPPRASAEASGAPDLSLLPPWGVSRIQHRLLCKMH